MIDLRREAVDLPRRRDRRAAARCPATPPATALVDLGDAQRLRRLGPRPAPLPRRRLRPGPDRAPPHGRPQRVPALGDRALGRSRGEPAEAQDPQEDRRDARAQESGRHQRRQEPAAAPLRRLARPRAATSSRAARSLDRARSRATELARGAARARHRRAAWCGCVRRARERRARRRLHPQRQLARQPHHLAHVPRSEPLPLLQRRARRALRRAGARAHRAHA